MSVFGIGTNTQDKDAGAIKGKQIEIACECWFTKSGRTMPLLIKFQDEEGETQYTVKLVFFKQTCKWVMRHY